MAHTRRLSRSVNTARRLVRCQRTLQHCPKSRHAPHDGQSHAQTTSTESCVHSHAHTHIVDRGAVHFHALAPRPLLSRVSGGGTATSCARCRRLRDSGGARVAAHTHPLAHTHTHATGAGSLSARRPTFGSVPQSTACTARHSSDGFTSERGCAHPIPASPHAPVPHSTRPCPHTQVSRPAVRPVDV